MSKRRVVRGHCRHGLSTEDQDAWNCAYYEDPAHQEPAGPAIRRPPPCDPDLDLIRWIEDYAHGPSRPRTWRCTLIFWRPCPHKV